MPAILRICRILSFCIRRVRRPSLYPCLKIFMLPNRRPIRICTFTALDLATSAQTTQLARTFAEQHTFVQYKFVLRLQSQINPCGHEDQRQRRHDRTDPNYQTLTRRMVDEIRYHTFGRDSSWNLGEWDSGREFGGHYCRQICDYEAGETKDKSVI